jgi:predicted ATPase
MVVGISLPQPNLAHFRRAPPKTQPTTPWTMRHSRLMIGLTERGRAHGHSGLAAELGPREVRGRAAIGREFSHDLLAAVACKPENELGLSLDRLTAAGLLFRQGVPPHATYAFKHGLVRDAAYGTLLRSRRQELHRQIVSVLQRGFAELVISQPELLAHHCSEAGMIAEAIEYCLLAAQRATASSNNTEKTAHIAWGITLVEQLPSSDQRAADFHIRLTLAGAARPSSRHLPTFRCRQKYRSR